MSNKQELIEMIHELDDDQLDDFAKDMLDGMTFAHNAGPAAKRKKMLTHLEGVEAADTTDESADEPAEDQGETEKSADEPEADATQESEPEPQPEPVKPKQRMLKNTKNGRLFPYNERLAKAKHIVFAPEE